MNIKDDNKIKRLFSSKVRTSENWLKFCTSGDERRNR
uniref:Uncharacterized protein n=1 Tax=Setaria italica TaxID=4555 RepID=K3YFQ3_SETIT